MSKGLNIITLSGFCIWTDRFHSRLCSYECEQRLLTQARRDFIFNPKALQKTFILSLLKMAKFLIGNLISLFSKKIGCQMQRSIIFCHVSLFHGHVNRFTIDYLMWGWIDRVQVRFYCSNYKPKSPSQT